MKKCKKKKSVRSKEVSRLVRITHNLLLATRKTILKQLLKILLNKISTLKLSRTVISRKVRARS